MGQGLLHSRAMDLDKARRRTPGRKACCVVKPGQ